jgi:DNA-binding response OmpR family regulator
MSDNAGPTAVADLDAQRAHRAFLANLRHELRTPINAILGYSEMLEEDARDRGQANIIPDLQRIQQAGNELLVLVNDFLANDKLEAGGLDMDLDALGEQLRFTLLTPVNTIIGYSELLLEEAADRAEIVPDLERILTAAQRFLALTTDVASLNRIRRGETSEQGASAAQALAEDAVRTIRPLDRAEDAAAQSVPSAVLIVDDNDINRDILARRLQRQGHLTTMAENGRQALELLRARKFDLVLLDIMMPELNGVQVLQRIKADRSLSDVPVIMISALDEVDSVVRCIEIGAEDYLPKPFNPVLLKARVEASLEKKHLRDQEVEYLRNVTLVTAAAAAVEANQFKPESMDEVAVRGDALGQLARVFQRMAREVYAREQRLKNQVLELTIQIDEAKRARQVAEITETDYFRDLQVKAQRLKNRPQSGADG